MRRGWHPAVERKWSHAKVLDQPNRRNWDSGVQLLTGASTMKWGFADPTRPAKDNVWIDWVSGAVVRQGLPVKVRKV